MLQVDILEYEKGSQKLKVKLDHVINNLFHFIFIPHAFHITFIRNLQIVITSEKCYELV